ncbi:MAG: DUF1501 domain-containing protein [Saprospiraceae bacterium]|nr:DUF1501 domain-containing protein [Saprospiraceae bacterium]
MKRRSFIQTSSTLSLPFVIGGSPLKAIGKSALSSIINGDSDRVLVLINLAGGNDGLTTMIPLDQYDNLAAVRSNVLVPENTILEIGADNGFHPSMGNLQIIWEQEKLNIVQSVGYPNQNRSHFRSTDIWNTASAADEYLTTGWLGRWLETQAPDYPAGYPNGECPDPFALTIGGVISETCQGTESTFSLALVDPANPGTVNVGEGSPLPGNCYGEELGYIREVAAQTNAYADVIVDANEKGNNLSQKYPGADANPLAQKLKIVARLISGGLQTKVYVVQLGGFDLHSGQVEANDPVQGRQTQLLTMLSDAICAFQDDISQLGVEERVLGMTYSEFGRQIRSNQSDGTDHGTAAPLFVFGSCVNPIIIGENPEIDRQVEPQEGVPMQYDFRSVYGSILMDWFEASEQDVKDLLFEDFQHIPIVKGCDFSTSVDSPLAQSVDVEIYPNPASNYLRIRFKSFNEKVRLSVFDARGAEVKLLSDRRYNEGEHTLTSEVSELQSGNYFVRVVAGSRQKTVKVIKI